MCKINSGALIKNRQDVQNLIVATLFRQEETYDIKQMVSLVSHYMVGSPVKMEEEKLYGLVSDNLDDLYIRNKVKCKNGRYIPQPMSNSAIRRGIFQSDCLSQNAVVESKNDKWVDNG